MAVYYPSNVNCYQQDPIYLNHHHHQQQPSSSSSAAASFVGGEENVRNEMDFIPPTGIQNLNGDVPVPSSELTFGDGQRLSLSLLGTQISLPSFTISNTNRVSPQILQSRLRKRRRLAKRCCCWVNLILQPVQSLLEEVVSVEKEISQMRKKKKGEDFNSSAKETESGGALVVRYR